MKDECVNGECNNEVEDEHTCPFQAEINDDEEYQCRCCESCTYDCAQEI